MTEKEFPCICCSNWSSSEFSHFRFSFSGLYCSWNNQIWSLALIWLDNPVSLLKVCKLLSITANSVYLFLSSLSWCKCLSVNTDSTLIDNCPSLESKISRNYFILSWNILYYAINQVIRVSFVEFCISFVLNYR